MSDEKTVSFSIEVFEHGGKIGHWWGARSKELDLQDSGHNSPLEALQGFAERWANEATLRSAPKADQ